MVFHVHQRWLAIPAFFPSLAAGMPWPRSIAEREQFGKLFSLFLWIGDVACFR